MIDRSTTLQAVRNKACYMEGDVLECPEGNKAVVIDVMASLRHQGIYYRLNWEIPSKSPVVPHRAAKDWSKVDEIKRPYSI